VSQRQNLVNRSCHLICHPRSTFWGRRSVVDRGCVTRQRMAQLAAKVGKALYRSPCLSIRRCICNLSTHTTGHSADQSASAGYLEPCMASTCTSPYLRREWCCRCECDSRARFAIGLYDLSHRAPQIATTATKAILIAAQTPSTLRPSRRPCEHRQRAATIFCHCTYTSRAEITEQR
jgi:hypothetical protein